MLWFLAIVVVLAVAVVFNVGLLACAMAGPAGVDADQPVPRPLVDHQPRCDPRVQPDRSGGRPVDRLRDHGEQPGPAAGRLGAGRRHAAARGDRLAAAAASW